VNQNPDKEKEKEDKSLHQDKEKKKEDEKENTKKSKTKKTLEIPLLSDLNGGDGDDDEDELYDDGELVDENDDNFELKPPKSNSRKRKGREPPKVAAKKTKTKSQPSQMFIDPAIKETLEKRMQILESKMADLEIQNKQLRHQLATSTETVGTKKRLHPDFPYLVEARTGWGKVALVIPSAAF
jgi:hypothetical protein